MSVLIVIPARYGSTRLPGKPLREIAGVPMLLRTFCNAEKAAAQLRTEGLTVQTIIATDDPRIEEFCEARDLPIVMTSSDLETGSDRARVAADHVDPDGSEIAFILNLQGDAPFTPPVHILAVIQKLIASKADAATPYVQLGWTELDCLRQHKDKAPFSGTTLIENSENQAVWFSKSIIPAIRNEAHLRQAGDLSPIKRHIGLYAFKRSVLNRFSDLPQTHYEQLEGLEQLRLLESGFSIACVRVDPPLISIGGIDTETDIELAEHLIATQGDPYYLSDAL